MAILWFGRGTKLEDLKLKDLRQERVKQEVLQDQLVARMRRAQEEYDSVLAAAKQPGLSEGELDIAAYRMSRAEKRKEVAEADLQQVQSRIQVLDSTMDVLQQKAALEKKGIWKVFNEMEEGQLQQQLEELAQQRKKGALTVDRISEILDTDSMTVKSRRTAAFRRAREAINAARGQ